MDRVTVTSSNIRSVGYDSGKRMLEVEFQGGHVHQFSDVDPTTHAKMMMADRHPDQSVGKYFHSNVRGKFPSTKLEPAKADA